MIIEALAVGLVSVVTILAWVWLVHRIFVVEPKLRREQRSNNLAGLRQMGKDKTRSMDVWPF